MKNHKGAVAALLTLGLVIVGTLVTLGTSLFVNKIKTTASNSRALMPCEIPQGECVDSCGSLNLCSSSCSKQGSRDRLCTSTIPTNTPEPNAPGNPTKTPTPGGRNSCCKIYAVNKYECAGTGKSKVMNTGNNYESSCEANGYKDCSSITGAPTASGAYMCLNLGGENAPPEGSLNGSCRVNDPKCDGTMTCSGGLCKYDGEDYPADDSCWIVKCIGGEAQVMEPAFTTSLSQYDMPLSSCPDGSPYSGGGWTVIGRANADKKAKTFNCTGGNVEVTIVPTSTPTPKKSPTPTPKKTTTPTPTPIGGGTCSTQTSTCPDTSPKKGQKFTYYQSSIDVCKGDQLNTNCYGSSNRNCREFSWRTLLNNYCSVIITPPNTPTLPPPGSSGQFIYEYIGKNYMCNSDYINATQCNQAKYCDTNDVPVECQEKLTKSVSNWCCVKINYGTEPTNVSCSLYTGYHQTKQEALDDCMSCRRFFAENKTCNVFKQENEYITTCCDN